MNLTLNKLYQLMGSIYSHNITQPESYYFVIHSSSTDNYLLKRLAKYNTVVRPSGSIHIFQPTNLQEEYNCAEIRLTFALEAKLALQQQILTLLKETILPASKELLTLKRKLNDTY